MRTRIITAVIALALFIPVLIWHNTILFTIVMAMLSGVAVFELCNCIGANTLLKIIGTLVGASMPFVADIEITGDFTAAVFKHTALPAAIFCAAVMMMSYIFRPRKLFLPMYLASLIYPSTGFGLIVYYTRFEAFPNIFLMFFIVSWVTDTFAMLSGKYFGRIKLCPMLSPKKTVEGSVGGTAAATVAFVIYGSICNVPVLESVVMGILLSLAAQGGDLLASAVKRSYEIKDYGKVFPGHGGVMDRFDSVICVAHVFNAFYILYTVA